MSLFNQKTCPDCDRPYLAKACRECGFQEPNGHPKEIGTKETHLRKFTQCEWITRGIQCVLISTGYIQGMPWYCTFHFYYSRVQSQDEGHQERLFREWRHEHLLRYSHGPGVWWRTEEELLDALMRGKHIEKRDDEKMCLAIIEFLERHKPDSHELPMWRLFLDRVRDGEKIFG